VLVLHGGNVRSTIENSCFLLLRSLIEFIALLSFVIVLRKEPCWPTCEWKQWWTSALEAEKEQ
jgi:hypothetical protein